jgi:hypothetical protein
MHFADAAQSVLGIGHYGKPFKSLFDVAQCALKGGKVLKARLDNVFGLLQIPQILQVHDL